MCATCEKVILEEAEINKKSEEKSILCDSCGTWWYLPCAGLTLCDKPLDFWVCPRCLIDVKSSLDDVNFRNDSESDDDHIGSNLNQAIDDEEDVNVGASTSACEGESHVKTTNVCSVCLLSPFLLVWIIFVQFVGMQSMPGVVAMKKLPTLEI